MKIDESCRGCIRKKIKGYAELYQVPEEKREKVVREAEQYMDEADGRWSAPRIVTGVLDLMKEVSATPDPYEKTKRAYNMLLLGMEEQLFQKNRRAEDKLKAALQCAVAGNYIDFGALDDVNEEKLKGILESSHEIALDRQELENLRKELKEARQLMYIADNAGEIVLDKVCIRILKELYPQLEVTVLVRGEPVLNDATVEDAGLIGLDKMAKILSNGSDIPGTEYDQISEEAKESISRADLCIAKGQGNFESLRECGENIYYLFLCKCELFVKRFQVEPLTAALKNELRM